MPFLTTFDLASTDPLDLVDRQADVDWLRNSLESFLSAPDKSRGRALAILGERGTGKSIVMQKVVADLREIHAATTLFLIVNCATVRTQRGVYQAITRQAVQQLGVRADVDKALLETARLLETVAKFDDVKQQVLAEQVATHGAALQLRGAGKLLQALGISFGVNLERTSQTRQALEGSTRIDGLGLRDALTAFFEDLRTTRGFDVVVVLDNLDELDHEAITDDDQRTRLLGELDALLGLALAPIGLVVTVRTYFGGVLNRRIDGNRVLRRLSDADHSEIIRKRLAREPAAVQAALAAPACADCIERLAALAPTPLALLSWFRYLAENDLQAATSPQSDLRGLVTDRFAYVQSAVIDRIVKAFAGPEARISSERVLEACGGNRTIYNQLLHYQIVLPVDFWHPNEFTLMPDLHFMLDLP